MKVEYYVVPPGGGEMDYTFEVDSPDAPRVGDYVTLLVNEEGFGAFHVLHVVHQLQADPVGEHGGHTDPVYVSVQAHIEPVTHPVNFRGGMKKLYDFYNDNPRWAGKVKEFPASGY